VGNDVPLLFLLSLLLPPMVREELLRAVIKPKFNLCIIQRKSGRGAGGGTEKRGGVAY